MTEPIDLEDDNGQNAKRDRRLLHALVADLAPPDIEMACDECGGLVHQLCGPACPIRRARAALGQPFPPYVGTGLDG